MGSIRVRIYFVMGNLHYLYILSFQQTLHVIRAASPSCHSQHCYRSHSFYTRYIQPTATHNIATGLTPSTPDTYSPLQLTTLPEVSLLLHQIHTAHCHSQHCHRSHSFYTRYIQPTATHNIATGLTPSTPDTHRPLPLTTLLQVLPSRSLYRRYL
jgi:hypothetical protein